MERLTGLPGAADRKDLSITIIDMGFMTGLSPPFRAFLSGDSNGKFNFMQISLQML